MAWYRAGGGGIPASLKTNMNAVLNKKMGTATVYAPDAWPDTVNLLGKLPEKTVSGSIASFADGADDVPIKAGKFNIVASQAGTGTPSPSNPRAISGHTGMTITKAGKNLITAPEYTATTASLCLDLGRNITFSSVIFSFLATNTVVSATNAAIVDFREEDGTHHYLTLAMFYNENNVQFTANTPQNGRYRRAYANITFRYVYVFYMTNTFSYFTSDSVTEWQLETGSTVTTYVPFVTPETLAVSWQTEAGTVYSGELNVTTGVLTVTHAKQIYRGDDLTSVSLTYGQTAAGYTHLYFSISSTPLALSPSASNTLANMAVWGNANTGGLPTTECYSVLNAGTPTRLIVYWYVQKTWENVDAFKLWLNNNPFELYYALATPQTYQLTPHEINTLLGANNFYCDTGDSEVTYRRDIDLALAEQASNTRMLAAPLALGRTLDATETTDENADAKEEQENELDR